MSVSFSMQTTITNIIQSTLLTVGSSNTFFSVKVSGTGILQPHTFNGGLYSATTATNDGLWHNVAVTYDGTTLSIYVDGKLDTSGTQWTYSTTAIALNTQGNSGNCLGGFQGSTFYTGKLQYVKFYNYALQPPSSPPTIAPSAPTVKPSKAPIAPTAKPTTSVTNAVGVLYNSGIYI